MTLEFSPLNRIELRQAAELAARAFSDYEYFTNWFPNDEDMSYSMNGCLSTMITRWEVGV